MLIRNSARVSAAFISLGWALGASALIGCGPNVVGSTGGGGSGGDNTGGSGGCQTSTEVCNGFDDDCDGEVDEGCACVGGASQACYTGPSGTLNVGVCKEGSQLCKNGSWGPCLGETTPVGEICDAVDNDCDGEIDDGNSGDGGGCDAGLPGQCGKGAMKCVTGLFMCTQVVFPEPELCDGLDNNCNGLVDDGNPSGGGDCVTNLPGPCAQGTLSCSGGAAKCVPNKPPTTEECDNIDNDCNGFVDDGVAGGGLCDTGLPGQCSQGFSSCEAGVFTCDPFGPSNEFCDGDDNDCNGINDDVPGIGMPCGTGKPAPCMNGTFACGDFNLVCVPDTIPVPEACDGLDNNCNDKVDEGNPGGGAACVTGLPGVCGSGTITCQAGKLSCVANLGQNPELCSTPGDDNCDGHSATLFFSEAFANNDAGWTLDAEWEIGAAKTSVGHVSGNPDPGTDHTPTNDNGIAGVVIGGNADTQGQHPFQYLTSPLINVDPGATAVWLQYWRWLNSDFEPWMVNHVQVLNTLTNQWQDVWASEQNVTVDSAWTRQAFNITAHTKGGSTRVRFGFAIAADGAFVVSQWNVDDVVIATEPCE